MSVYTVFKAKSELEQLIREADSSHIPILISSQYSNAVLIAEHDWNAIQETLYLLSVPGMRDSVIEGMRTPIDECEREPTGETGNRSIQSRQRKTQENWLRAD